MEGRRRPVRARRAWLAVRAAGALFVLFAITADLLADSRCHRPERPPVRAGLSEANPSAGEDPCASGCLPDCYCCSKSVTYGPAVLPPDAGPVALMPALLAAAMPSGVRPLPYRPPLDLA